MKTRLMPVVVVMALVLPALAAQQRGSRGGKYDQQIQQEVTKEIQSHDKWKDVRASTEDGVVTLEGTIPVLIDKVNLERKVKSVDHVQGVRDLVQVSSNVPGSELEQKLADKLRYDRIGYGVTFNSLQLGVHNGVVTLQGKVLDYPSEASALAIVENTPGVKAVIDNVEVLPPSPMDDELRLRLARAIYGDPALQKYALDPQAPIRIVVNNGRVTLDGVVDSPMDKQIAEMRARSVPGVFELKDNLLVTSQQQK